MPEQLDDPFNDQPTVEEVVETAPEVEKPTEAESDQSGDKDSVEPPETQEGESRSVKAEKMIPESRFKAALKDATEKLEAANKELATFKAQPVPDKNSDPEGYDLHVRMEASKAAMRATHEDYQEVIEHYKELADENPLLNDMVSRHPIPAQYAYQIAKESMRINKLRELESSQEWKQFQEWKKTAVSSSENPPTASDKVSSQLSRDKPKVPPNLNSATNVSKAAQRRENDDELFRGAL